MSIRLVVTITAAPGKGAELAQAYKPRCAEAMQEPGCEQRLPHDECDRKGKQRAQGDVERCQCAAAVQEPLDGGAEREPEETAGQRGDDEQAPEERGLDDGATGLRAQIRPGGAHAHEPRFGVDPLKDG